MASKTKELIRNLHIKHDRVQVTFKKPSRVKREFKKDADINVIMDRFKKTGVLPINTKTPMYMDTTQVPNLQQAMEVMISAEKAFAALPAQVRKEFDNNPMNFVDYATKPENLPKLREWGLAPPEKEPEKPMKVEVVNQKDDKKDEKTRGEIA